MIGVILFVYYRDHDLAAPVITDRIYPAFSGAPSPRRCRAGDCSDSCGRDVESQRRSEFARVHYNYGFLQASCRRPVARDDEARYLRIANYSTVLWGGLLFRVGLIARNWGSVLEAGLSIASILYGALLGVFLLGFLTAIVSGLKKWLPWPE